MGKIKSILFLIVGAVSAIFLYENWLPAPPIRIFGKELVTISNSLVMIISLSLGLLIGLLIMLAFYRRRTRAMAAASAPQQTPESQGNQPHEEEKKS